MKSEPDWMRVFLAGIIAVVFFRAVYGFANSPAERNGTKRRDRGWASAVRAFAIVFELISVATTVSSIAGANTLAGASRTASNNVANNTADTQFSLTGAAVIVVALVVAGILYYKGHGIISALAFGILLLAAAAYFPTIRSLLSWWLVNPVAVIWNGAITVLAWIPDAFARLVG